MENLTLKTASAHQVLGRAYLKLQEARKEGLPTEEHERAVYDAWKTVKADEAKYRADNPDSISSRLHHWTPGTDAWRS